MDTSAVYRQADRIGLQSVRKPYFLYSSSQHLRHLGQHILALIRFLFEFLLFFFRFLQAEIFAGSGAEFLLLIVSENTYQEIIHIVCHIEDFVTLVANQFDLRQFFDLLNRSARRVE